MFNINLTSPRYGKFEMNIKWIRCIVSFLMCYTSINGFSITGAVDNAVKQIFSQVFPTKCFEYIGCFYSGPPFFSFYNRPSIYLPQDNLDVRYLLYVSPTQYNYYNMSLSNDSIADSPFNPKIPTKVIIPGYNVTLKLDKDIFDMKDALMNQSSYNVIIIDWTDANNYPYLQAVANGRKVGALTAFLLKMLKEKKGLKYEDVHIIGHSLGAHVAGWAGERLEKIGRITGLDPAGPYFQNAPPKVRLDATDANFVDIIHTNGANILLEGFGLYQPIGHVDFYPNGGRRQPHCRDDSLLFGFVDDNVCAHSISSKYFIASVSDCNFLSVQCKDYKTFISGKCSHNNSITDEMGFHAKKIPHIKGKTKFYLKTTADFPYCTPNNSTTK